MAELVIRIDSTLDPTGFKRVQGQIDKLTGSLQSLNRLSKQMMQPDASGWKKMEAAVDQVKKKREGAARSMAGQAKKLAAEEKKLASMMEASADAARDKNEATLKAAKTLDRYSKSAQTASGAVDELGDRYRQARKAARDYEQATDALAKGNRRRIAALKDQEQATKDLQQAQERLQRMKQSGTASRDDLDMGRAHVRNMQSNLRAMQQSLKQYEREVQQAEGRIVTAMRNMYRATAGLDDVAARLPASKAGDKARERVTEIKRMEQQYTQALDKLGTHVKQAATRARNSIQQSLGMQLSGAKISSQLSSTFKAIQNALKGVNASQRTAANAARPLLQAWRQMGQAAMALARTLAGPLASAISNVNRLLGSLGSGAASRFASLRKSLDATGDSFLRFGRNAQRGFGQFNDSLGRTAAGWSFLMTGQQMTQAGTMAFNRAQMAMSEYISFEDQATRGAIAGGMPVSEMTDLVFDIQKGVYGDPVRNLSSEDIAASLYAYISAIGVQVDDSNRAAVARTAIPMVQLAGFTQSDPEQATKGVINAAQEFGIDPRDITGNADELNAITALFGFLANETTMEVPDITEYFKMTGPLANVLHRQGGMQALEEMMAYSYVASDYGLRGSKPGRGMAQVLQSLLDPTGPMNEAAMKYWGEDDIKDVFFNSWQDPLTGEDGFSLKGGIEGLVTPFMGLSEEEWITAQSEIFTNNASRAMIPFIDAARNDPEHFQDLMAKFQSGDPTEFLFGGIEKASATFGATIQNLQNMWMNFVDSMIGANFTPLTGTIDALANTLGGFADVIDEIPLLGQALGGLFTTVAGGMVAIGSLLSFAGGLMVLQRALLLAGAGMSSFIGFFTLLPSLFLTALPVLAAIALGVAAARVAWEHNFLGMRDAWEGFQEVISSPQNVRDWFMGALNSDTFKSLYLWTIKAGQGFMQFVSGILLGIGPIDVFNGLMQDVFGQNAGLMISTYFIKGGDALRTFFGGLAQGANSLRSFLPTLTEAHSAFKGFFEVLTTGSLIENASALRDLGDRLGIDDLHIKFKAAVMPMREFALVLGGAIVTAAGAAASAFRTVREWLSGNWADGSILRWFQNLIDILTAFGSGVVQGFVRYMGVFADAITGAVNAIPALGRVINTEAIAPMREFGITAERVSTLIGGVFGATLAGALLLAVTPLRMLISYGGQFAGLALVMATRILAVVGSLAAQTAAFLFQTTVMGGLTVAMAGYNLVKASYIAMTTAATGATFAFTAALAPLGIIVGALVLALGSLVVAIGGIFMLAGVVGIVMTLQGGFDGLLTAVHSFAAGLWAVVGPMAEFVYYVGIIAVQTVSAASGFRDLSDLMFILGAASGATILGIVGITAVLLALPLAIGTVIAGLALLAVAMVSIFDGEANPLDLLTLTMLEGAASAAITFMEIGTQLGNALIMGLNVALEEVWKDLQSNTAMGRAMNTLNGGEPYGLKDIGLIDFDAAEATAFTDLVFGGMRQDIIDEMGTTGSEGADAFWSNLQSGMQEDFPSLYGMVEGLFTGEGLDFKKMSQMWGLDSFKADMRAYTAQSGTSFLQDYLGLLPPESVERELVKYQNEMDQAIADHAALNRQNVADGVIGPDVFAGRGVGIEVPDMMEGRTWPTELLPDDEAPQGKPIADWQMEFTDAMMQLSTSTDIMPWIQGGISDMPRWMRQGNYLSRNVSGYETTAWMSEDLMSGLGENMPWLNPTELLLDTAGAGIGQQNMAGKYLDKAFSGVIAKWSRESGISTAEIEEMIPDYYFDESLMGPATADFFSQLNRAQGWTPGNIQSLDVLGTTGFTRQDGSWFDPASYNAGAGFDSEEFMQFLISNAMSGNPGFDPLQYFADQWDMTIAEVESYMSANGVDPAMVRESWGYDNLDNIVGMHNTMGGQIVALTEDWWGYINDVTADGTDKTVEITQAAYSALPDFVKLSMAQMGYQFVIGGQQTVAQAEANANMVSEALRSGYGDAWTQVEEEVRNGTANVSREWDAASEQWMVTITDMEGNVLTLPEAEYQAFISSLNAAKQAAFAADPIKALQDLWAGKQGFGDWDVNFGVAGPDKFSGRGIGYEVPDISDAAPKLPPMDVELNLKLPENLDTSGMATTISTQISTEVSTAFAANPPDIKVKVGIDFNHFSDEVSSVLTAMAAVSNIDTYKIKVGVEISVSDIQTALNTALAGSGIGAGGSLAGGGLGGGGLSINVIARVTDVQMPTMREDGKNSIDVIAKVTSVELPGQEAKSFYNFDAAARVVTIDWPTTGEDEGPMIDVTAKVTSMDLSMITSVAGENGVKIPATVTPTVDSMALAATLSSISLALTALTMNTYEVTLEGDASELSTVMISAGNWLDAFEGRNATTTLHASQLPFTGTMGSVNLALLGFEGRNATTSLFANVSAFAVAMMIANGTVSAFDARSATVDIYANTMPFYGAIAGLNGSTVATTYIDVVSRSVGGVRGMVGRAGGGTVREPVTLVGEEGPELVSLPYGSVVHTASETASYLDEGSPSLMAMRSIASSNTSATQQRTSPPEPSGDIHIHIQGDVHIGEQQDLERFVEDIDYLLGKRNIAAQRGQVSIEYGRVED